MQNMADAVHETALNSDKTAQQIAAEMVMDYQVLLNKANPRSDNDNFTWHQIQMLVHHSKNPLIGQELTRLAGRSTDDINDLLTAVLVAGTEQGNLRQVLLEVNADGVITRKESIQVINRLNILRRALDGIEATVISHVKDI